ncbi:MAG: hypothetical protein JWO86_4768 [Myxococcaceae bacterium]|nr:hypothetical protein [Myxococcaceae bacterium]
MFDVFNVEHPERRSHDGAQREPISVCPADKHEGSAVRSRAAVFAIGVGLAEGRGMGPERMFGNGVSLIPLTIVRIYPPERSHLGFYEVLALH